ncbi:type II toxin-antitoxin system HigB family toxin [Pedobacter aquae]|uniref:Type II toxin-antitoxin system HigB family toxin n=1 Tax=Pedobacter aquae TaxID=2605747 RepID=A0A5C0VIR7_9SPHI|nr:type II toxin-antitoxin system HigB family toxin [Pedobacter aquae]QEK51969.1 type II toxin-antitoxin system HigB family toxin [Pedobacter aquae]
MNHFNIIKRSTLIEFYTKYPDAKKPIELWYSEIRESDFSNFNELKAVYKHASIVATNNRVVFNIKGNNYRLVVKINFYTKQIFIIWFGTHKDYDKIDVETISYKK